MELLRGGELYSNICGRSILTELEAYRIIAPLTDCLRYLHNMGIIHRDIKPENILCNSSLFDVKIADFGFSKLVFPKEKLDFPCGTINYIAPEVIARKGYTTKADMWSLGIIFYLIMRGRLPFDGKSKDEIIHQVIYDEPDYTNKSFLRLSKNCQSVIKGLLNKDPDLRFSAEDLMHHPWFMEMQKQLDQQSLKPIDASLSEASTLQNEKSSESTLCHVKIPAELEDSEWVRSKKEELESLTPSSFRFTPESRESDEAPNKAKETESKAHSEEHSEEVEKLRIPPEESVECTELQSVREEAPNKPEKPPEELPKEQAKQLSNNISDFASLNERSVETLSSENVASTVPSHSVNEGCV